MNITQIEENIKQLATDFQANKVPKEQFIYDFLLAYGHRKSSVSRVKSGERNLSKVVGEVRWKRHVYFKHFESNNLRLEADQLKNDPAISRDRIRFVIVTDFNSFLAIDNKTGDSLDIKFDDIVKHFDFFLPWAQIEKAVYQGENPADVKAAEKMAELFDIIKADNFDNANKNDKEALHNLNVFLTRLLFCFFAEDTEIFSRNQFSHALESHTHADGSDVAEYLNRLFNVLNTSNANRNELPDYLDKFPFVNGGLFAKELPAPTFSTKSRKMLIECGKGLDWSDINPDIFGSMIQAVVHPDQRGGMGMHYTSVTNIMKIIDPLFLDALYKELENIQFNIDEKLKPSRLRKLKERISKIKIFDPACGSGNFLIIAFKELRKLEMEVIKLLQEIEYDKHQNQDDLFADIGLNSSFSEIKLSQFYGIELDDFAHEVAILSLWLAEHQMNIEFKTEFGDCEPTLPLQQSGNIIQGNSNEIDWLKVCPLYENEETFLLGNPPYIGARNQTSEQKAEMRNVLTGVKGVNSLDYITSWFYKGAKYIEKGCNGVAFVSTNSIVQGEQVSLFWPHILEQKNISISFAHTSFKWVNNAKNKAGVTCVIIGLSNRDKSTSKKLYDGTLIKNVKNISPYLTATDNLYIHKRKVPISKFPIMTYGNQPIEGGFLTLNKNEKDALLLVEPKSKKFVRPLSGGNEFLKGINRWCIWINDEDLEEASSLPAIKSRIDSVRVFREGGGQVARSLVDRSHQFRYRHEAKNSFILMPCTSSERREYLQLGFYDSKYLTTHSAQIINDSEAFIFGVLSSRAHMIWTKAVGGCLESRIRYSNVLCYNNFPFPDITELKKQKITECTLKILGIRESYPDAKISDLYDPDKMPEPLLIAHKNLDEVINKCYEVSTFETEDEHLSFLFNLYKQMTGGQNA